METKKSLTVQLKKITRNILAISNLNIDLFYVLRDSHSLQQFEWQTVKYSKPMHWLGQKKSI